MATIDIPLPDTVLEDLVDELSVLHELIDIGNQDSQTFFKEKQFLFEPSTHASILRCSVKSNLEKRGVHVHLERGMLANCGLLLTSPKGYNLRILKSEEGHLPLAGVSKARQQYYNQYKRFQLHLNWPIVGYLDKLDLLLERVNLVLHWVIEPKSGTLDKVILSCPESGNAKRATSYWDREVPRFRKEKQSQPVILGQSILQDQEDLGLEYLDDEQQDLAQ